MRSRQDSRGFSCQRTAGMIQRRVRCGPEETWARACVGKRGAWADHGDGCRSERSWCPAGTLFPALADGHCQSRAGLFSGSLRGFSGALPLFQAQLLPASARRVCFFLDPSPWCFVGTQQPWRQQSCFARPPEVRSNYRPVAAKNRWCMVSSLPGPSSRSQKRCQ